MAGADERGFLPAAIPHEFYEHRDRGRFERVVERGEALAPVPLREGGPAPPWRESLYAEAGVREVVARGIHPRGWSAIGTAAGIVTRYRDGGRNSI
ncbi:MAG: hypothetical protein ABFC38_09105 [Methanospirillum sp.]